jgi:hypothetical protein
VTNVELIVGSDELEVVGESFYQDELWRAVGRRTTERVRVDIEAELRAEPDNPYDSNAVSVSIGGLKVGHLSREDARSHRQGLLDLQARTGRRIILRGVITGGGVRQDGPGYLGVWLSYDASAFGLDAVVPPAPVLMGAMRTGLTEALLTDTEDDSYDLSWLQGLPAEPLAAIRQLQELLQHDPDPIDRHFMFCELEERLYRSREVFASALAEYDDACVRHDSEMNGICDALLAKFGAVPLLPTYRQMAIRQQKIKNWQQALWWVNRGLELYGDHAARPEAVDDLQTRQAAYQAKLNPISRAPAPRKPASGTSPSQSTAPSFETLVCATCDGHFERQIMRGRKPLNCPACR